MKLRLYTPQIEKERHFDSKEAAMSYFLTENYQKLTVLPFITSEIKRLQVTSIVSFGANVGVLEYLLSLILPDLHIHSNDIVPCAVMNVASFNLKTDRLNTYPEMAIFLGSLYVLEDEEMIDLLTQLREHGVKYILDFHAGCIEGWRLIWWSLKKPSSGIFHGYCRNPLALKKIYRKSGYHVTRPSNRVHFSYVNCYLNYRVFLLTELP